MDYKEKLQLKEDINKKVFTLLSNEGFNVHEIKGAVALGIEGEVVLISAVVKKNFDLVEAITEYAAKLAEKEAEEDAE